jgi:PAS domain S-box-containing protein
MATSKSIFRTTNERMLRTAFAFAVLVWLSIVIIIFLNAFKLRQDNDHASQTQLVLDSLERTLLTITQAQSIKRAYVITGREQFYTGFQTAVGNSKTQIAVLRSFAADDPVQQARIDNLESLVTDKLGYMQQVVDARRNQGFEAAQVLIMSDQTRSTLTDVREAINAIRTHESDLLKAQLAEVQASSNRTLGVFGIGAMGSLAVMGWIFRMLRREVEDHVRTEGALETERNLLHTLMDNLPDSIFIKDTQSRFVINNGLHRRLLGIGSQQEIVGKTDFDLFPHEIAAPFYADEQQIVRSGQPLIDREEPVVYANGERRWHLATKMPLYNSQGELYGIVGISRDITERKRKDEEILRLNDDLAKRATALEAANRELEAFSYSVSHDLRAPLRAIDGYSRLLEDDHATEFGPNTVRYLGLVRTNAKKMGTLIDDLLSFSRLGRQVLTKQTVEPSRLVKQALEELDNEQKERNVTISIGTLPSCQGDPALLKQVFINLLANALKFTRQRDVATIEVRCDTVNGEHIFAVIDNGAGFDMAYANKLFGVFQRLHGENEYEGTGVGLAIVQRIISRHGGRIWADAEVGQGATFRFTLGE